MFICVTLFNEKQTNVAQPRIVWCEQLIGSATVCGILRIDRSTLTRRIARGEIVPLAKLDGAKGAYVFDRSDFPAASR